MSTDAQWGGAVIAKGSGSLPPRRHRRFEGLIVFQSATSHSSFKVQGRIDACSRFVCALGSLALSGLLAMERTGVRRMTR